MMPVVITIVVLLALFFGLYNSLVGKKNQVENAFAGIDTLLKKRYDLIPNLVSTVQQYMQHERSLLTEITELRSKATSGTLSDDEKVALNNKISRAIGSIMVAVENYPNLKASENFMHLQRSLSEVEEQISASRRAYNASVTDYNNAVEMVPTNIIAGMFHFTKKTWFEADEAERKNVNVGDMFNKNK